MFFALANYLYNKEDVDVAIFWFHAGFLKESFDAIRCADISARSAIPALLSQITVELRNCQLAYVKKLKSIISKVVKWDRIRIRPTTMTIVGVNFIK